MKELLLGTTNLAKVHIVRASADGLPLRIVTPGDLGLQVRVQESGRTTVQNAEAKAMAYFAAAHMPTLAIDGGLHIQGLAEKQPGAFVRRMAGRHRDATDEEVLDHYRSELAKLGGESTGLWEGAHALAVSSGRLLAETYSFQTILTSRRRGSVTPGSPLDVLTIDPATGRYLSEMPWAERPDARWLAQFLAQHLDAL